MNMKTNRSLLLAAGAVAAAALVACAPVESGSGGGGSAASGISRAAGEQACREALIDFHSVDDVRIVSSEPYQGGGRFVRGSVIANFDTGARELWQCIAYPDGTTGELAYLTDDPDATGSGASATARGADPEVAAQDACRSAVSRETGNANVSILGSDFSEAGTRVVVGVGPQQAPWQCFAYSDGTTDRIMFLGEG
jgi:hypothetical protein